MNNYQPHIANIVDYKDSLLVVNSIHPDKDFLPGGKLCGYRKTWNINFYSFSFNVETQKAAYNLTNEEYNYWLKKFANKETK